MAIDPNNRPIRVINDDTTDQEMQDGHRIPNADPPKNEAARGGFGIVEHLVRHAMGRDDARFVGDAELGENLGSGAQGVPVAAGAHDHAHYRRGTAHGRCFRGS